MRINIIENCWIEFIDMVMVKPLGKESIQYIETRKAFYAGWIAFYQTIELTIVKNKSIRSMLEIIKENIYSYFEQSKESS